MAYVGFDLDRAPVLVSAAEGVASDVNASHDAIAATGGPLGDVTSLTAKFALAGTWLDSLASGLRTVWAFFEQLDAESLVMIGEAHGFFLDHDSLAEMVAAVEAARTGRRRCGPPSTIPRSPSSAPPAPSPTTRATGSTRSACSPG